ncbi:MAG: M16 family metallopeptidase, partial [Kiritimatiellia bacterium]
AAADVVLDALAVNRAEPHATQGTDQRRLRNLLRARGRALGGGVLAERDGEAGLTHLMAELLTRGAAGRSAAEIAQTVEALGGTLAPFSGYNSFGIQSHFLRRDAKVCMALLADCLTAPAFDAGELDQQKTLQLAALDEQREQPVQVAMQGVDAALYPQHPYRWTPLGRREDVTAFTSERVRRHFQAQTVTGNMVVSLFGDVSAAEARAWLAPLAGRLRNASAPLRTACTNQPVLPARIEQRMPKDQAVVVLGFPGVTVRDPRAPALEMLQSALSGLSSKLMITIRDQRGLAYYVSANQRLGMDPGIFVIYAGTHADKADEVEQLILAEIERLRTQGLDSNEMARATSQLLADVDMRRQDNDALAVNAALNELYGLGADYASGTAARLAAVTPELLRAAAGAVLDTNRVCVSRVLPQSGGAAERGKDK